MRMAQEKVRGVHVKVGRGIANLLGDIVIERVECRGAGLEGAEELLVAHGLPRAIHDRLATDTCAGYGHVISLRALEGSGWNVLCCLCRLV